MEREPPTREPPTPVISTDAACPDNVFSARAMFNWTNLVNFPRQDSLEVRAHVNEMGVKRPSRPILSITFMQPIYRS